MKIHQFGVDATEKPLTTSAIGIRKTDDDELLDEPHFELRPTVAFFYAPLRALLSKYRLPMFGNRCCIHYCRAQNVSYNRELLS
jgi:hypothetical protein